MATGNRLADSGYLIIEAEDYEDFIKKTNTGDTGIFQVAFSGFSHMMFHGYLKDIPASGFRRALEDLFKVLDTKADDILNHLVECNDMKEKANAGLILCLYRLKYL